MITQLQSINKIYDLLALCSSYILREIVTMPYEFATFNDEEYEHIYDIIEKYNVEKEYRGCQKAFEELREYIINFMGNQVTVEKCYAIVKYIDELVEAELSDKLLGGNHIIPYTALNEQYSDCVRIIPVMKQTLLTRGDKCFRTYDKSGYSLFRKKHDCECSMLDKGVINYSIWDESYIQKFPMKIYRIDEKNQIFKHFYDREKIVFGIVPFTDKKLKEVLKVAYQGKAFHIEYMHKNAEKELKKKYKDVLERCENEDIDFLIFPEMLMTENIFSTIKNNEKKNSLQFVINGSIWKDYTNKCVVTDGGGNEILSYYKKDSFKYEEKGVEYTEHLDSQKNQEYSVIEIEGLGRIGVCICKDLTYEKVKTFHKCAGTDILLVPAYSKSMDLMSSADNLSQEYLCIVVVANACSALSGDSKEGKRIGFLTMPAKNNSDRTNILKTYTQNECIKECNHKCVGKKITVDFYHTKEYEEGISFEIKESLF